MEASTLLAETIKPNTEGLGDLGGCCVTRCNEKTTQREKMRRQIKLEGLEFEKAEAKVRKAAKAEVQTRYERTAGK